MQNARLDEAQAGIKTAGRNIKNLRYAEDTTLMGEREEELKGLFDEPMDVGNLIFGSSAFSKTSLNIWKFIVHVLLEPGLENFELYFTSM